MSIGSSAAYPTSSRKARETLQIFSMIQPKDKLRFHKTTDTFEIDRGGRDFARTFSNVFRKAGTENSVTNDDMFHTPIVLVFKVARFTADITELNRAYDGLRNLAKTYEKESAKLASLNKTLAAVRQTIDEPIKLSAESLQNLSEALSRQAVLIFSEYAEQADVGMASSIVQQMNRCDRASLQVVFAAVRNDGSRINNGLIRIGECLNFFSEAPKNKDPRKSNRLDVTHISDLVYNVLQEVEKADVQSYLLTDYERWIKKIKAVVQAKEFSTFFQGSKKIAFDSDTAGHPASDFLWFYRNPIPQVNITRLYFCPTRIFDVDRFIGVAGDIIRSGRFVFKFKIDYRKDMKFERKDAIVLYFEGDIETGRALAAEFKTRLVPGYFKPNFGPFDGTSVSVDNDVFWQAEPDRFDTGLNASEQRPVIRNGNRTGRQHSATSIRAELITMALLKWKIDFDYQVAKCAVNGLDKPDLKNPQTFDYEFEMFQSFVARALDGYKHLLNPRLDA